MSETGRCPECGAVLTADMPEGLCPACLLQQVVAGPSGAELGAEPAATTGYPAEGPLSPAQLAPHFPQLEILSLLGQGGMGAVYKARQPKLDRFVALKVLPPAAGRDPAFAERFLREARALAKLNHPAIVSVHDFGQAGPLYYFIMEYVDGVNLRQPLQAGRLSPAEVLALIPKICDALQYAHEEGVVHRDIKPENILLDRKGRVKIADFGLAKLLGPTPASLRLTHTHQVMGTPHYMAPEQMEQPLLVDHRADIYSLGVVFYEMLTGELPLGRFALPSEKAAVDVQLDAVVLRALAREPQRRYQHVSDVKTAVESLGSGQLPASGSRAIPVGRKRLSRVAMGTWTLVCALAFIVLGWPSINGPHSRDAWVGVIDQHFWPYEGRSGHSVTLTPRTVEEQLKFDGPTDPRGPRPAVLQPRYRALVLREVQVVRFDGFATAGTGWDAFPASNPGCVRWQFVLELHRRDGQIVAFTLDALNRLVRRIIDPSGVIQDVSQPVTQVDIQNWIYSNSANDPWVADTSHQAAVELLRIINEACAEVGLKLPDNDRSFGKLEFLVQRHAGALAQTPGSPPYPFVNYRRTGAYERHVEPRVPILLVSIPVALLVWLGGLWLMERRQRTLAPPEPSPERAWLRQLLTYFWTQPPRGSALPVSEVPGASPRPRIPTLPQTLAQQVRRLTLALLIIGILEAIGFLFTMFLGTVQIIKDRRSKEPFDTWGWSLIMTGLALGLAHATLLMVSALQFGKLRSYRWAVASCVVALLPASVAWILTFPLGIWAVVLLTRPGVSEAVSEEREDGASAAP